MENVFYFNEKKMILVVDDSPDDLSLISAILKDFYIVKVVNNGEKALQIAGGGRSPDLVLLDIMMPKMDGYEVCRRLKHNPATCGIPVIFLTSMVADESEEAGLSLGAVDYITKPVSPPILLARVKTQLQLKASADFLRDQNAILEAEVARREAILHAVTVAARDAIVMTDDEDRVAFWNPAAEAMFGYTAAGILRRGLPESLESLRFKHGAPQIQGDGTVVAVEGMLERDVCRRDGTEVPVEISLSAIMREHNWWSVAIVRDITERKRTAKELAESQALLDSIVNSTTDLIWSVDPETFGLTSFNLAFSDHYRKNLKFDVKLGMRPEELLPPAASPESWKDFYKTALREGSFFYEYQMISSPTVLELNMHLLKHGTSIFGISVFARDITEIRLAKKKIVDYVKQLEGAMEQTLQAVANMVEMRDPYTAGHERRVGLIAAAIAGELGWPEESCRQLQMIGLVHDIGKISVPADILAKPTHLTDTEYQIVQAHATQGYEILKDIHLPVPIGEIIHQHHERMDGSGYPRGLKGDEILPEARILAIADVMESMTSHRPYRPTLGIDAALKEIVEHRGTAFDASMVDAMLSLIRDKGYQLPE